MYLPQKTKRMKIRSGYDLLMWPANFGIWTIFMGHINAVMKMPKTLAGGSLGMWSLVLQLLLGSIRKHDGVPKWPQGKVGCTDNLSLDYRCKCELKGNIGKHEQECHGTTTEQEC